MTEAQRKSFYFPIWKATADNLDWKMEQGRLVADVAVQLRLSGNFPAHAAAQVQGVISLAQSIAGAAKRAVTAEDLRHACNRVATAGKTDSCTKFSQRDLNQFDRLCAVLRGPWDLTATIAWQDPVEDDRKRSLAYLRKLANDGRLIAISRNTWGITDLDALTQVRLDALLNEIKRSAWSKYPRSQAAGRRPF